MFDGFSVGSGIPHMADQMQAQTKAIMDALEELRTRIKPMAETWTGDAAGMWAQVQSTWTGATNDMQQRFGKAQVTLNQSYDNYRRTDANIAGKFTGL
ncbi:MULTISPECIES: WXG100 family type VII secretion target [unclassified Crossiella]|uniref:WXG100 family type VII secretion target n=1 Tax=unclassified Crossiella TaxID=2620835 RepID=UPI001FFFC332|nr:MULTISPECIES: WXG100 family type VII secretion target [unclassified Crossiella]MCK2239947.1 WXG100 family type VII secretion target [Crossiella sp. S99.2]MCK2252655.1 WXG100 family type VII secretion target [Crossiella sp. S99.1]